MTMTTKLTGEDVVRKQTEAWNSHDASRVAAGYVQDATVSDPIYTEALAGREAIAKDASDFFTAFPDIKFQTTRVIAHGDTVVYEGMSRGTHKGPLQLPAGLIPATGRRLEFGVAIFFELDSNGSIRKERRYYDVAGLLTQLGLLQ
jgi:steroid delta-isomerase-like uncharacterized protein